MANDQKWFLVKLNWNEWLLELSDEDAGKFIKALYNSEVPEGMLGLLFKSHYEEFVRVNEKREEMLQKRSEAGKKGMTNRWHNKQVTDDNK